MVEKLKEYLELYRAERNDIACQDDEAKIMEEVAEYETKVRAEFADKKQKILDRKDNDIIAIETLIERVAKDEEETPVAIDVEETNTNEETENVLGGGDLLGL